MESYLINKDELLTVISMGQQSITVRGAGGFEYHAKCLPTHSSLQAMPLQLQDILRVMHVNPDRSAVVERVTHGSPDGCQYMLYDYVPVSKHD
ncbi:MAG: hypothetical protein WD688_20370 [Candidatus Binatia bacterium]